MPQHGVVTFAMRRSHHIGCLAALAKQATDRRLLRHDRLLRARTPSAVAPFGGKAGPVQPQSLRHRLPYDRSPVLVDTCASITTVSMTREKAAAGELFEHPWLMDSAGRPTRDPSVMERRYRSRQPAAARRRRGGPQGVRPRPDGRGPDAGAVGPGRQDAPTRWGASVYLQLIDPDAFAGREAFIEQMDFFVDRCHANAPIDPDRPVRLPGEQASRTIEQCRGGRAGFR